MRSVLWGPLVHMKFSILLWLRFVRLAPDELEEDRINSIWLTSTSHCGWLPFSGRLTSSSQPLPTPSQFSNSLLLINNFTPSCCYVSSLYTSAQISHFYTITLDKFGSKQCIDVSSFVLTCHWNSLPVLQLFASSSYVPSVLHFLLGSNFVLFSFLAEQAWQPPQSQLLYQIVVTHIFVVNQGCCVTCLIQL